jgi:tRNA 2-thiouridine synthesizing protein A
MAEIVLDTKGMKCPLPVLKARKALKDVAPGGILRVIATDPGAKTDFDHFCKTTGCRLVAFSDEGGVLTFALQKP